MALLGDCRPLIKTNLVWSNSTNAPPPGYTLNAGGIAALDGATGWQAFRRITLPLLKPALLVALIFRTSQAFMVFGHIYTLTGGGPGNATESLAFLAYQAILNDMRFGYGSAICILIFLSSFVLALLYLRCLFRNLFVSQSHTVPNKVLFRLTQIL